MLCSTTTTTYYYYSTITLEESHRLRVQVDFGVHVGVDGRVPVVVIAARVTVGVDAVYTVVAISSVVVVVVVAATTVVVVVVAATATATAVVVVVVSVVVGNTRFAAAAIVSVVSIISSSSSSSSIVATATWKTLRIEAVYAIGASSSTLTLSRVIALAVRSESCKGLVEIRLGIAVFPCAERAFFVDRMESVYDGRLGVFAAIAVDFVVDAFGVRAQVDARGRLGRSGL